MTASYRLSAALALLSLPRGGEGTSIKTDYLPLGHVRTDPILSQTCLTDHVHTFYGPNVMPRPEVTFEDLVATAATDNTGNVEENKSLYWHPTVYRYDQLTGTYTRNEIGQSSAYYIWANEDSPRAFPPGFRMIAGRNGDTESEFPNAFAECVEPSPCLRPDGCHTENDFFPREACVELEVSMFFPNCWDGRLDSADHASHVAYTIEEGEVDGTCPDTHPLKIPQAPSPRASLTLILIILNTPSPSHNSRLTLPLPHTLAIRYPSSSASSTTTAGGTPSPTGRAPSTPTTSCARRPHPTRPSACHAHPTCPSACHRHPTCPSACHRHPTCPSACHRHPTCPSACHRLPTCPSACHRHPTYPSACRPHLLSSLTAERLGPRFHAGRPGQL